MIPRKMFGYVCLALAICAFSAAGFCCLNACSPAARQKETKIATSIAPWLVDGCRLAEDFTNDMPWVVLACDTAEAADRQLGALPANTIAVKNVGENMSVGLVVVMKPKDTFDAGIQ
jgi:hypothetical protein